MTDLSPAELIEAHQQRLDAEQALPEGVNALTLLQMVYRGEVKVTPQQMRAAMAALPFEVPKLAVTTNAPWTDSLADALERALIRSGKVHELKLIEHQPQSASPAPLPPHGTPRVGPTPDRRFRRG
jgi:hypothetical protein